MAGPWDGNLIRLENNPYFRQVLEHPEDGDDCVLTVSLVSSQPCLAPSQFLWISPGYVINGFRASNEYVDSQLVSGVRRLADHTDGKTK